MPSRTLPWRRALCNQAVLSPSSSKAGRLLLLLSSSSPPEEKEEEGGEEGCCWRRVTPWTTTVVRCSCSQAWQSSTPPPSTSFKEDKSPQNAVGGRRLPPSLPPPPPSPRKADVKVDKQARPIKHAGGGGRALADNASTDGASEDEDGEGREEGASGAVRPSRRRGVWVARARRASAWV